MPNKKKFDFKKLMEARMIWLFILSILGGGTTIGIVPLYDYLHTDDVQRVESNLLAFKGEYRQDKQAQEMQIKQDRIWKFEDRKCNGDPCKKSQIEDDMIWQGYRRLKKEVDSYYKALEE